MIQELYDLLRELERRASLASFTYFFEYVYCQQFESPDGKTKIDWHHRYGCQRLQELWDRRDGANRHLAIRFAWPRDTLKTSLLSAFCTWCLLKDRNLRILIESEAATNSQKILVSIKRTFEGDYFRYLFGTVYNDKEGWNLETLTVKRTMNFKEPSVDVGGIETTKTGQHYDLYLGDDLQTDKNSTSWTLIQKVIDHVKQVFNLLTSNGNKRGLAIFSGTRWHFDDLFNWMDETNLEALKTGNPPMFETCDFSSFKGEPFASDIEFGSIETLQTLLHKRTVLGEFQFSCQMLLKPVSEGSAAFKGQWILNHDETYERLRGMGCNFYCTLDPAGRGGFDKADYWALVVAAFSPRYDFYVMEYIRDHLTVEGAFRHMLEFHKRYNLKKIGVETVFKQKAMYLDLKAKSALEGIRLPWAEFTTSRQTKESRILGLQPFVENGKFRIRAEHKDLKDEMIRYPKGAHDDLLDASAYLLDLVGITSPHSVPGEFWNQPGWRTLLEDHKLELPKSMQKAPSDMDIKAWQFCKAYENSGKVQRRAKAQNFGFGGEKIRLGVG